MCAHEDKFYNVSITTTVVVVTYLPTVVVHDISLSSVTSYLASSISLHNPNLRYIHQGIGMFINVIVETTLFVD